MKLLEQRDQGRRLYFADESGGVPASTAFGPGPALILTGPEGGFTARALDASIFTQAESTEELHTRVRDAVRCHFDSDKIPKMIRLHFVRDEVIAA